MPRVATGSYVKHRTPILACSCEGVKEKLKLASPFSSIFPFPFADRVARVPIVVMVVCWYTPPHGPAETERRLKGRHDMCNAVLISGTRSGQGPAAVLPPTNFDYDVFVSYNKAQEEWAEQLAVELDKRGFRVWFAKWTIRGGEVSSKAMRLGVEQSRHVVAVFSDEFLKSDWTDFELSIAILLDPSNKARKILPLVHTKCEPPRELARLSWIDFSDTHGEEVRFQYRLAQLLSDLAPDRFERPKDFKRFSEGRGKAETDSLPPVRALPKGSRMPRAANPRFVGREKELRDLARKLLPGTGGTVGVHTATGGAGVGRRNWPSSTPTATAATIREACSGWIWRRRKTR